MDDARAVPAPDAATFAPRVGSRVRWALFVSAAVVAAVVLGVLDPHEWAVWILAAVQLPTTVLRWLEIRRALQEPWALALDARGVWWTPKGPPLPWTAIAMIEVRGARGIRRLLPHRDLVLLISHASAAFARRANFRPSGRMILLDQVRASPEELIAAFRPFTDAPAWLRLR